MKEEGLTDDEWLALFHIGYAKGQDDYDAGVFLDPYLEGGDWPLEKRRALSRGWGEGMDSMFRAAALSIDIKA